MNRLNSFISKVFALASLILAHSAIAQLDPVFECHQDCASRCGATMSTMGNSQCQLMCSMSEDRCVRNARAKLEAEARNRGPAPPPPPKPPDPVYQLGESKVRPVLGQSYANIFYEYDKFDPIMPSIEQLDRDGQMVIECAYPTGGGRPGKGERAYRYSFWYPSAPKNIEAILAADKNGMLRYVGSKGVKQCPATDKDALDLRRAAMVEAGYKP